MIVPPLAHVTGTVEPGEVYGGFGPASAFTWLGSCVGGCGARPGCREDSPAPECSGCGRARHGITHDGGAIGHIVPVPARILPGELDDGDVMPTKVLTLPQQSITVLRAAAEVSRDDPSLPAAVRTLLALAGPSARVFAAVVRRNADGAVSASLAVRVPGVGHAVYERPEGGSWGWLRGILDRPTRRCNAGQFTAALKGVEYVPPAPRETAPKGPCPNCAAEVSLTKAGAVFKSHKCTTRAIEGRS